MDPLLIRLLIGVLIIFLTQTILSTLAIQEPANKAIFVVVLVLILLYIVFGGTAFPRIS